MKTTSRVRATLSLITIGLLACTGLAVGATVDDYAESFETYAPGDTVTNFTAVAGSVWTATETNSMIVSTNYSASYMGGDYPIPGNHTKVLEVVNGVTNTIAAGADNQTNWVDVVIKPVISPDEPSLPSAGSVAAVYFNASSNLVVSYAPSVWSTTLAWLEIPEFQVGADDWIRLTIAVNMKDGSDENEAVRYFRIYVNGTAVTNGAAYTDPTSVSALGGSWFASGAPFSRSASVTNVIVQGTGFLDDLVMTNSLTVTVSTMWDITATAGANGSIAPSGTVSVVEGQNKTFTISPDSGYSIDDVVVVEGGVTNNYPGTNSYTFVNVMTNGSIDATFVMATTTNGTPISYYGQFGLTPAGEGLTTWEELDAYDSDGDGVPNMDEYTAGTDPTDPDSTFRILGASVSTTNVTVRWIGGTNGPLVPYIVESATSLGGPIAWSNTSNHTRQEGTNTWSSGEAPGSMRFYQIRATSE